MFFQTPQLDLDLLVFINQQCHSAWLNLPMQLLSSRLALFILLPLIMAWAVRKHGRRVLPLFLLLLLAMGATDLTTNMVKSQVQRVRPLNAIPLTHFVEDGQWQQRPEHYFRTKTAGTSYPSGHAANTACLAVLALLIWPAVGKKILWLPFLVGLSRLYLGKHYPTDVLAGWLFGGVVAGFVWLAWSLRIRSWAAKTWPKWVE